MPVQVEVPVTIDESVCSAFRFSNDKFKPQPPVGYSDYSADTNIELTITNNNTNEVLSNEQIMLPIKADTCAQLTAFTWTPDASLLDVPVKFRVDTNVIDSQVLTSTPDFAEDTEVIYPQDLSTSCWSRAYDFTLTNTNSFDLTTSVTQITEGEYLYSLFRSAAFCGNDNTPVPYTVDVQFDGTSIYTTTMPATADLADKMVDLSNNILGLPTGNHEVTLVTTPIAPDASFTNIKSVTQTQNLHILPVAKFDINFNVKDSDFTFLEGANIEVNLVNADDHFQTKPTYSQILTTNTNGNVQFTGAYRGNYTYTVSKPGYISQSANFHIGADLTITITLPEENIAPVVAVPNFTEYYENAVVINTRDYVTDYNDLYSDLAITAQVISGTATITNTNGILRVSTTTPNEVVLRITAQDPSGLTGTDTTTISFIKNQAPVINSFVAEPQSGETPLDVTFSADITDAENDALTCTIDFGDGVTITNSCNAINGISHTFIGVATYDVTLKVNDGKNVPVSAQTQVFVFERTYAAPHIDSFTLDSSNNNHLPTDLTLNWAVSHPDSLNMTCVLRVNAVSYPVSCVGEQNIFNYNVEGLGRFSIYVVDELGKEVSRVIERTFTQENNAPVINLFEANPNTGINTLDTKFTINVADIDADDLVCTLNFGDTTSQTAACDELDQVEHSYALGAYNAILEVTDGYETVYGYETINVVNADNVAPIINWFDLTTADNTFKVPNDVTLNWNSLSPIGSDLTCTLTINDNETLNVPCSGSHTIVDFNTTGTSTFNLLVVDSNSLNATETKTQFFTRGNDSELVESANVDLVIANTIVPGEFIFKIITKNETLASRIIEVKPVIICGDTVENTLVYPTSGKLSTSAISSSNKKDGFEFIFKTNTNDFNAIVKTDVQCRFRVDLTDKYGTNLRMNKFVTFSYPKQPEQLQSIRGKGTDIAEFMASALATPLTKGYNSVSFNVVNNENTKKELVITMTAQNLGFNYKLDLNLGPGQEREVSIPMLVNSDFKSGLYPVRFGVYDGKDKQVRYSYLDIQ